MNQPLVTISIPTYNSENFLERCLDAIKNQTYQNIEINIIDGASKDATVEIAKKYGIDVITCTDALLAARYEGLKVANGDYVLLLDSDQVLEPDAIQKCVDMAEEHTIDMIVLEEDVYKTDHLLEKLFQQDRKLIHQVKDFNPYTSVMLPRFYRTDLLKRAFSHIPEEVLRGVGGQDHAIIYFEAWQESRSVNLVSHAVKHIEPSSIKLMVKKFFRWGYSSTAALHPRYEELLSKKERFRKGMFSRGLWTASFASILLLLIKGVPFFSGRMYRKLKASS